MSYMPCMIPRMIWEGTFFFHLEANRTIWRLNNSTQRPCPTTSACGSLPCQPNHSLCRSGRKTIRAIGAIECTPSKPENDKGMNTGDRMFQTCLGSLNTRRTLYTSLQNVDSIHQKSAKQQHSCGQEVELQLICDIHPSEYCMTRCCRMVSRWQTNLLPDFEPTCAMPSVKRIPSDWSAFLGVQFIASYYMDSQLVNLCVIQYC